VSAYVMINTGVSSYRLGHVTGALGAGRAAFLWCRATISCADRAKSEDIIYTRQSVLKGVAASREPTRIGAAPTWHDELLLCTYLSLCMYCRHKCMQY
jgi:hypothetical protein